MKQLFSYKNENDARGAEKILLISLAERFAGYCICDPAASIVYSLSFFGCGPDESIDLHLFREKNAVLSDRYSKIIIGLDFHNTQFLPDSTDHSKTAESILGLQDATVSGQVIYADELPSRHLRNLYAIPAKTDAWIHQHFPAAICRHFFTATLLTAKEDGLYADFGTDEFSVVLINENKLQLAQHFIYETAADLIWYFLNCCHQHSISQQELVLKLSGFLEKDSALYKELYQYFLHPDLQEAAWGPVGEYPAHYFTSFNRLAQCVS